MCRALGYHGSPRSVLPGSNSQLGEDPIYLAEFLPEEVCKMISFKSTLYYLKTNFDKIAPTSLYGSEQLGWLAEFIIREHFVFQNKERGNKRKKYPFLEWFFVICKFPPNSGAGWSWSLHGDSTRGVLESQALVPAPVPQLVSCTSWSKLLYFVRPLPHLYLKRL